MFEVAGAILTFLGGTVIAGLVILALLGVVMAAIGAVSVVLAPIVWIAERLPEPTPRNVSMIGVIFVGVWGVLMQMMLLGAVSDSNPALIFSGIVGFALLATAAWFAVTDAILAIARGMLGREARKDDDASWR